MDLMFFARWRPRRLLSMLLVLCALLRPLPGATHATGVSVSIFYPTTKAAYNAWNNTSSNARPPKTTSFPSGIKTVGFYLEYSGAKPNVTNYKIIIHDHSGG